MYTALETIESSRWDAFVCQHPRAHFLQLSTWGTLKSEFGWQPQQVGLVTADGTVVAGAQILYRRLLFGVGKLAYIPFGPLLNWENRQQVQALFQALDSTLRRNRTAFLKIEPGYDVPEETLRQFRFRRSAQTVQPPRTLLIDIGGVAQDGTPIDEAVIQQGMNQSTRRNIRKSAKHNVEVRQATTRNDVESFNQLLEITSDRQEFGVHIPSYYRRIFELFIDQPSSLNAALLLASYTDPDTQQRTDLAGVITFALGQQSWYQYGASSNLERQRMAMFGAQWAAIQWARKQGATVYDMVGVPDEAPATLEAHFKERSDGLWGVYRFKRGWGGRVVRTVGAWDRVYNPLIYGLYQVYVNWRTARNTSQSE